MLAASLMRALGAFIVLAASPARALGALIVLAASPACATFHLWEIAEVYSNADGTVQYIELATASSGQDETQGVTFRSRSNGVTLNSLALPGDLGSNTTNGKTFILATPGFQAVSGIAPDFTLPCVPFFDPAATSITVELVGADALTFAKTALPPDSGQALYATPAGVLSTAAATPQNFAGSDGAMTAPCLAAASCDPCGDALFCTDSCLSGQCMGAFVRCLEGTCDEDANVCDLATTTTTIPPTTTTTTLETTTTTTLPETTTTLASTTTTTLAPPLCGDFNNSGGLTATDALGVLRTAVGSAACEICVCDVNGSGGFTASDALVVLRAALGLPSALNCSDC